MNEKFAKLKGGPRLSIEKEDRCQFHQHKRTNFSYERRFFTYMYLEKSCRNDVSYKKFVRKLLMKLTVGQPIQLQ